MLAASHVRAVEGGELSNGVDLVASMPPNKRLKLTARVA